MQREKSAREKRAIGIDQIVPKVFDCSISLNTCVAARSVTGKFERGASGKKGAGQRGSLITQKRNSSAGLGFEEVVLEAMRKENESKANAKRNSAVGLVDRVCGSALSNSEAVPGSQCMLKG
eukprot:612806-Rhodomonas_salina.1